MKITLCLRPIISVSYLFLVVHLYILRARPPCGGQLVYYCTNSTNYSCVCNKLQQECTSLLLAIQICSSILP